MGTTHRRTVEVMGTVVSLALRGRHADGPEVDALWAEVVGVLRHADEVFSTYLPDSPINRWGRGELSLAEAPPEIAEVLALAEDARLLSGGAFDIRATRSQYGGGPDPSGVVKGWAVQRASALLERLADTDFCLSAGGDMVCRTRRVDAEPWWIGIEDPVDPTRLIARVPVHNGAVATSGTVHRGEHIMDPRTGSPARALRQVTVIGPDLTEVDTEATSAFVLGDEASGWLQARRRTGVLVHADGRVEVVAPAAGRRVTPVRPGAPRSSGSR
ncbi:thiamine biosynthesis protein ApbE [Nocardioides aromaticivorans]|uniref:FAD:protein FMN transferase n=1 Tax=Nocardioides aromaticivorans TaxID=200618 RepID=A0ABX7PGK9_9ACTN|nr:FAD:protein FMN transferase [Nocardioides aromaticivorans]QSR24907.1 thiamine biosynthesis protein ApbE [Nocardioides aromaticivorans]